MDALALINRLDVSAIEARLAEIRAERQALLVLLRAARCRGRRPQAVERRDGGSDRRARA